MSGGMVATLQRVERQIDALIDTALAQAESQGINPYQMRHPDGRLVLADLLVAKAQTRAALVTLGDRS